MKNDLRKANRGDWLELWGALWVLLKKGIRDKYQGWKKLIRMRRGDQIFENKHGRVKCISGDLFHESISLKELGQALEIGRHEILDIKEIKERAFACPNLERVMNKLYIGSVKEQAAYKADIAVLFEGMPTEVLLTTKTIGINIGAVSWMSASGVTFLKYKIVGDFSIKESAMETVKDLYAKGGHLQFVDCMKTFKTLGDDKEILGVLLSEYYQRNIKSSKVSDIICSLKDNTLGRYDRKDITRRMKSFLYTQAVRGTPSGYLREERCAVGGIICVTPDDVYCDLSSNKHDYTEYVFRTAHFDSSIRYAKGKFEKEGDDFYVYLNFNIRGGRDRDEEKEIQEAACK